MVLISIIMISSCVTKKDTQQTTLGVLPPIIIYKTKKDYSNNVPVILSEDKTKIVSFPAPRDLKRGDELALPEPLAKGYLLDRRGINKNVAFTKFTYEEYSKLTKTPKVSELFDAIIDDDPLKRMYICGTGSVTDEIKKEIIQNIKKRKLKVYKRMK